MNTNKKKQSKILAICLVFLMLFSNISVIVLATPNNLENTNQPNNNQLEILENQEIDPNLENIPDQLNNEKPIPVTKDSKLIEIEEISSKEFNLLTKEFSNELTAKNSKNNTKGNGQLPTEIDGNKIENLTVIWKTQDEDDDPSRLHLVWNDNEKKMAQAQIDFALSGQNDYEIGSIQVEIPKNIFKDRFNNDHGKVILSVPEAPDNTGLFAYTDIGDKFLLTNTKKLSAASSISIQLSFRNLIPSQIKDFASGYVTDQFNADLKVLTHAGNLMGMKSNNIDCSIDTSTLIKDGKVRHNSILYIEYPEEWPQDIKPTNHEDYVYVPYNVFALNQTNQYFNVVLDINARNSIDANNAIVLGYKNRRDGVITPGNNSGTLEVQVVNNDFFRSGGNFHGNIYVAYPKSSFTEQRNYELNIQCNWTMTGVDDLVTTTTTDDATFIVAPAQLIIPTGNVFIHKEGYGDITERYRSKDIGIYSTIFNKLLNNEDSSIFYDIYGGAFGGGWTLKEGGNPNNINDYQQRDYTVQIKDYDLRFNNNPSLTSEDFEVKKLKIPKPLVQEFFELEGITFEYNGAIFTVDNQPLFGYTPTNDINIPLLHIFVKISEGEWDEVATLDYSSGEPIFNSISQEVSFNNNEITLPSNVTDWKIEATTKKAYIGISIIPEVLIKASTKNKNYINQLYTSSTMPSLEARNMARTDAILHDIQYDGPIDMGVDKLSGFAYGAAIEKELQHYVNNPSQRNVKITYKVEVKSQTNLNTLYELNKAIEDNLYEPLTSGIYYDLLPKGATPIIESIQLRYGDSIEDIEVIENFRNSGRTMLIVKATLNPKYSYEYLSDRSILNTKGYYDSPTLTFDVNYPWIKVDEYGSTLDNNVVFESGNDRFGMVEDYTGEPDDPTYGNHCYSENAASGVEDILTNLNENHNNESFVYAKNTSSLLIDMYTITSLQKNVDVNKEGKFGDGLTETIPKNVYSNGFYTYDLRIKNTSNTKSKDIIFYDNLEAFTPDEGTRDANDIQWRGALQSVNTSYLEDHYGVAPVIYYSTTTGLILDDTNNREHLDLTNTSIWSTTMPEDKWSITAVAIDIRKLANNEDFVLLEDETAYVTLNMRAPNVSDFTDNLSEYWDTVLENEETEENAGGAHAYNNVSTVLTNIAEDNSENPNQLIRHDYTKVGFKPYSIKVNKIWNDGYNRDGMRPLETTIRLLANGVDSGIFVVLNENNNWTHLFENIQAIDENGQKINYTIKEDPIEGYTDLIELVESTNALDSYKITNKHDPIKINVSGTKQWINDNEDNRPEEIYVELFANDRYIRRIKVTPINGEWTYTFNNLYKYENGEEIQYEVKERKYIEGYISSTDGFDVINTYNPFGTITLSKLVTNLVPGQDAQDYDFSFMFLLKDKNGEDNPIELDWNTTLGKSGKIASGSIIQIKVGEILTIENVPSDVEYTVEEVDLPNGFINTHYQNNTGKLIAGEIKDVLFTNEYQTYGDYVLEGNKILTGRDLRPFEFIFDLFNSDNQIIASVSNNSEGLIRFGSLKYSNQDVGNIYTYTIKERNLNKPGLTYDDHVETFTVEIVDNGDGTITPIVTFDEDEIIFNNEYHASGNVQLKAWKTLKGGFDLTPGQFNFQVLDESTDEVVATGTNDENGLIDFSLLEFNETHVGNTYIIIANEEIGTDDDIIYDNSTVRYTITVYDNGDGTLSFDAFAEDLYTEDINNDPSLPMFVNKYKNGSLTISKFIRGEWRNQPFRFKVKLRGPLDLIPDGEFELIRNQVEPPMLIVYQSFIPTRSDGGVYLDEQEDGVYSFYLPDPKLYAPSSSGWCTMFGLEQEPLQEGTQILYTVVDGQVTSVIVEGIGEIIYYFEEHYGFNAFYFSPEGGGGVYSANRSKSDNFNNVNSAKVNNNFDMPIIAKTGPKGDPVLVESGTFGEVTWEFFDNGLLNLKPTNEISGTLDSYINNGWKHPWSEHYLDILSINIESGVIANADSSYLFANLYNVKQINLINLDTSQTINMNYMFYELYALQELDLQNFNTSNVETMYGMFTGCRFETLDLNSFDTTNVQNMGAMFSNCSNLKTLNINSFNTENVIDMSYMFHFCLELETLNLNNFNTSNVKTFNEMFRYCSSLTALDLTNFNTTEANTMRAMFAYCLNLESLDLSSFNTINISDMNWMFDGSDKLNLLILGPDFRFIGNPNLTNSTQNKLYTDKWIKEDLTQGPYTPNQLYIAYNNNPNMHQGNWIREPGPPSYVIEFDSNGGTGMMDYVRLFVDEEITLPIGQFYKPNELFSHWNTASDNSGISYFANQTYQNLAEPGETLVLYAIYEPRPPLDNAHFINGEIEFILYGNESITLPELPAGLTYEVYEELPSGWALVNKTNDFGTILPNNEVNSRFTNEESPWDEHSVSIVFEGTKLLDGNPKENFEFELYAIDPFNGVPYERILIDTASSSYDGVFVFNPMLFYYSYFCVYEIKEKNTGNQNINYDNQTNGILLYIEEDYDTGELIPHIFTGIDVDIFDFNTLPDSLEGLEENTPIIFNNTTKLGSLIIKKTINNPPIGITIPDFTINVKLDNDLIGTDYTLGLGEEKTISINNLKYGTKFEITEINLPAGYELETITNNIGIIGSSSETTEIIVTNKYSSNGSVMIQAKKEFIDSTIQGNPLIPLEGGEFEFQLFDADQQVIDVVTNDANGDIFFNLIEYTQPGVYNYTIKEIKGNDKTIEYDQHTYNVQVTVTENGDGTLSTNILFNGASELTLTNTKIFDGVMPEEDMYYAYLIKDIIDLNGNSIEPKVNDEFNFIVNVEDSLGNEITESFSYMYYNLTLDKLVSGSMYSGDTFTMPASDMKIDLINEELLTVTFYDLPENAFLTFTELDSDNYEFVSELSQTGCIAKLEDLIDEESFAIFTNRYLPKGNLDLSGTKTIKGKDIKDYTFEFLLLKDGQILQTIQNTASGEINFETIYFDQEDVGNTYTYVIVEKEGASKNILYDNKVYEFDITISLDNNGEIVIENTLTKEIKFNNVYRMQFMPTGSTNILTTIIILLIFDTLIICIIKKQKEKIKE